MEEQVNREHQATYNPNMPVRQMMYLGRQYDKYIKRTKQNIYGRKQMTLPVPRLVTFYNGVEDIPDKLLKLSDSFPCGTDPERSDVEVRVHMYNVRSQAQSHLIKKCRPLAEYAWFVEEIRRNQKDMDLTHAVDKAISDMPEGFVIKEFIKGNQSEVKNMCITEYDEAETMELFKEEGREEGLLEGEDIRRQQAEKIEEQAGKIEEQAGKIEKQEAELKALKAELERLMMEIEKIKTAAM